MKKMYLLLFCFSCFSLNGQHTKLKLTKVKINSKDKYPIKGYLFDIDSEKIVLVPKRELVKKFLISKNCKTCYTIPNNMIRDIKFSHKKTFIPVGLMVSGVLGLILETNKSSNDYTNLYLEIIAKIAALAGITAGVVLDIVRFNNHSKRKVKLDGGTGLSKLIQSRAAIYQFNELRNKQLEVLSNILAQIKKDKTSYRKWVKVYTNDRKLVAGYIINQQDGMLLLGLDKKEVVKQRNNPPDNLRKVPLSNIFYYEFSKW